MGTILTILIYVGLFYFMMRYGCCGMSHGSHGRRHTGNEDAPHGGHGTHSDGVSLTAVDPVCGMAVGSNEGYGRSYHGREYRFCSRKCLDQFESNPDHYAIEERLAS